MRRAIFTILITTYLLATQNSTTKLMHNLKSNYPGLYKNILICTKAKNNAQSKTKLKNLFKYLPTFQKITNLTILQQEFPKIIQRRYKLNKILKNTQKIYNAPAFANTIKKAQSYLQNWQISKYHNILQTYRKTNNKNSTIKEYAQSLYLQAKEYYSRMQYPSALYFAKQAAKSFDTNSIYQSFCATLLLSLGKNEDAIIYYNKALKIDLKNYGKEHLRIAAIYDNISKAYQDIDELETALEYQQKALKLTQKLLGDKHHSLAIIYNNISTIYQDMGELETALEYQQKALKLTNKNNPDLSIYYNNIASIYQDMEDLEQMLVYQKKDLALTKKLFDSKHQDLIPKYNAISTTYQDMGEYKKALAYQESAISLTKELFGSSHPSLAANYNNIATIYKDLKDYKKAIEYLKKDITLTKKTLGSNHPNLGSSYINMAQIYYQDSNKSNAKKYINKAVELLSHAFPNGHPYLDIALEWQEIINKNTTQ